MSDLLSGLVPHCFGVCGWLEPATDDDKEPLVALDDVRELLLDYKTREVIRTVMWRHKQYTTTGPVRCSCGHWKPDAGMFDMHLAEEIQKALAGGDDE